MQEKEYKDLKKVALLNTKEKFTELSNQLLYFNNAVKKIKQSIKELKEEIKHYEK